MPQAKPISSLGRHTQAQRDFDSAAMRIKNGYTLRVNNPNRTVQMDGAEKVLKRQPWDTANGFFQREAYALITQTMGERGGPSLLQRSARDSDYLPPNTRYSENPFLWGLHAIDPDASCLGKGAKKAIRFARLITHAHRNRVPPIYLIGFLRQIGGYRTLDSEYQSPALDPSLKIGVH